MTEKIKLANIPVGKSINAFGKNFTVLEHTDEGTLVLSDNIAAKMPFRDKCEAAIAPNDFRDSDICQYLNGMYLSQLKNSDENTDAILDMEMDLKCTLGQREYGFFKSKVGLLTLEQYGKYYYVIPKIDNCWWLATPHGTPTYTTYTYNTRSVWLVGTNGNYYYNGCNNSCGVRPALLLDSSLLVACYDMPDDRAAPLSEFSDEGLLEEIKRRFKTKGVRKNG